MSKTVSCEATTDGLLAGFTNEGQGWNSNRGDVFKLLKIVYNGFERKQYDKRVNEVTVLCFLDEFLDWKGRKYEN